MGSVPFATGIGTKKKKSRQRLKSLIFFQLSINNEGHDSQKKKSTLLAEGKNLNEILRILRENGYSKIQSMKVLVDLQGITLSKAKEIVHLSDIWQDTYKQDEEFQEKIEEALGKE